ncbi:PLP-dependent aminotransferase family protein [Microbispora bryophytorum]|uniref:aminotransferase-like domain-containing protein n=1 Tax=Microbispora bryophytorum TaxID=1460882 RepID=UPI0033FE26F2
MTGRTNSRAAVPRAFRSRRAAQRLRLRPVPGQGPAHPAILLDGRRSRPPGGTGTAPERPRPGDLSRILEDDPYGELRYDGEPLPPLSSYPGGEGNSIYLGSFSKIGAPGLRLGWLRAPNDLRHSLTVAKQATDLHTSTVDQAAAARYLAVTDLDDRIRSLRDAYRPRRNAMMDALATITPPGTTWSIPDGGMCVWVRLPGEIDTAQLLQRALHHHVAFVPGAPFYCGEPDRATLRLSFSAYTPERTTEGMHRLGEALNDTLTMPGGAARRATATTPYKHIDSLFGDHVIDQGLIEKH